MLDKMRNDDFLCDVTLLVCTISNISKTYKGLFTPDEIQPVIDIQSVIVQHCVNGDGLKGSVTHYGLNIGQIFFSKDIGLNFVMCERSLII